MIKFIKNLLVFSFIFSIVGLTMAATTPDLGDASSFGVLSSTYTNTAGGIINGDLGYTTAPVTPTTVIGLIFTPSPSQAGLDQAIALSNLNGQACTFTFAAGAIDLATDSSHGTIGIYEPGVYCTTATSAASIGTSGIILSGAGTYIFRINGAFDTVDNSVVTLNGPSACDVFWTPTSATTLGANTTFMGTIIDDAGITVGSTTSWLGRALNFATTVTTNNATITVPVCGAATKLHVIKQVINDNGGTANASLFNIYVKRFGTNVSGSPASGTVSPGTSYTLNAGAYLVSEDINSSYTQSFTGDCSSTGFIKLLNGEEKICTIINDDIAIPSGGGGGGSTLRKDDCPEGDFSDSYYDRQCGIAPVVITGTVITGTIITGTVVITGNVVVVAPSFPKTGLSPEDKNIPWNMVIQALIVISVGIFIAVVLRKSKI